MEMGLKMLFKFSGSSVRPAYPEQHKQQSSLDKCPFSATLLTGYHCDEDATSGLEINFTPFKHEPLPLISLGL